MDVDDAVSKEASALIGPSRHGVGCVRRVGRRRAAPIGWCCPHWNPGPTRAFLLVIVVVVVVVVIVVAVVDV